MTLKLLDEYKILVPICQNYFSNLKKYTETEQFRNCIYGITALVKMDINSLPDLIKSGMPKIIESLIKLMHNYVKERERETIEELEDKVGDIVKEGETESEDVKVKRSHLEKLREITVAEEEEEKKREVDEKEGEEEDEDDDDYLWSRTDNYYYKSTLDVLEAPLYFRDVMQAMKEEKPEEYESFVAIISPDNQSLLEMIIQR
jgi:predicted transcriptional regulator